MELAGYDISAAISTETRPNRIQPRTANLCNTARGRGAWSLGCGRGLLETLSLSTRV